MHLIDDLLDSVGGVASLMQGQDGDAALLLGRLHAVPKSREQCVHIEQSLFRLEAFPTLKKFGNSYTPIWKWDTMLGVEVHSYE